MDLKTKLKEHDSPLITLQSHQRSSDAALSSATKKHTSFLKILLPAALNPSVESAAFKPAAMQPLAPASHLKTRCYIASGPGHIRGSARRYICSCSAFGHGCRFSCTEHVAPQPLPSSIPPPDMASHIMTRPEQAMMHFRGQRLPGGGNLAPTSTFRPSRLTPTLS